MKKVISLAIILMFILTGCSSKTGIENNNWTLSRITDSSTGEVLFCTAENESSYNGAKVIDLDCTADESKITITNSVTSENWSIDYSVNEEIKPEGSAYAITYSSDTENLKGFATVGKNSANEDYLIVTLGGYSIYFNIV